MPRRSIPGFALNGSTVTLWQASNDLAFFRDELEQEAIKTPPEDKTLAFFAQVFYPRLAAVTEPAPSLEKAYHLTDEQIDGWAHSVQDLNPAWFDFPELTEQTFEFSDGRIIRILSKRPSVIIKRVRLEEAALTPVENEPGRRTKFRLGLYPKLAGMSAGDLPDMEYARTEYTDEEIVAWYMACRSMIPDWFLSDAELAEESRLESESKKKTSRRRARKSLAS